MSIGSISSTRATPHSNTQLKAARNETGFAARISQLGPTLGTAVATGEAFSDVAKAAYAAAVDGVQQLDQGAQTALKAATQAFEDIGEAAEDAGEAIESAVYTVADTVGDAASAVSSTFSKGLDQLGKLVDFSA
ncbi:hypothetical protein C7444_11863 [Sphaerotilus hippei]|uniref:Uncharacterized protein n=1 Tax=Sphaerotilus hippei TaxID=744406 RepID=A0A318H7E7_9BURK|nr:hypothetical protein [Sphaerotilus hippei]PXW93694.1 hypothetical protein C7444_11863 [Sphaerotilus hippei]